MKKEIGLWLDHRQAVIVTLHGDEADIQHVDSEFEKRVRFSGASETHDPNQNDDSAEDKRDRKLNDQLTRFYNDILGHLRDFSRPAPDRRVPRGTLPSDQICLMTRPPTAFFGGSLSIVNFTSNGV